MDVSISFHFPDDCSGCLKICQVSSNGMRCSTFVTMTVANTFFFQVLKISKLSMVMDRSLRLHWLIQDVCKSGTYRITVCIVPCSSRGYRQIQPFIFWKFRSSRWWPVRTLCPVIVPDWYRSTRARSGFGCPETWCRTLVPTIPRLNAV